MVNLSSQGIGVDVPRGWDGEIYRRSGGFDALGSDGSVAKAVLHLGNFPLPAVRGDYGSNAVEAMGPDNVLIVLFEFGEESVDTALFHRRGLPQVRAGDFAGHTLQRTLPGQAGAQFFFNEVGRAFCLYVVLGAYARRNELVPEVNAVLATVNLASL